MCTEVENRLEDLVKKWLNARDNKRQISQKDGEELMQNFINKSVRKSKSKLLINVSRLGTFSKHKDSKKTVLLLK